MAKKTITKDNWSKYTFSKSRADKKKDLDRVRKETGLEQKVERLK